MTEPESAFESLVPTRFPKRHGAPWESEEFHQLIEGIEEDLTLAQLANRHQRTPGGISGAAIRLIPPTLRPDSRTCAVDVLARFLRENADVDRQSLVCSVCATPTVRIAIDSAIRSTLAGEKQARSSETVSKKIDNARAKDMGEELLANAVSQSDGTSCTDSRDVLMLVSVAVASLPKKRDRDILGMRLGLDGQPLTLAEIGVEWGVSRERVRQIQEVALRRLAARARNAGTSGAFLKKLLEPVCASLNVLATWLLDVARGGFEIPPCLAAKFILRTAGFAKARSTEVVTLMPAIERSRMAKLSELARNRAATERNESIINKWLNYSDWPEAPLPPPPAAQMSAQRVVNDSDIAGSFHSQKLNRTVHYESGLELEILRLLDRSEQVAYYQEQPILIPYLFKGRHRKYYPDLFVATVQGRGLLIEVKPTESMAISINRAKADAGRAWAHARGWGWLVVSDRHTFRQIEEHVIPAAGWTLLDNELRTRGVLTWRDMISLRKRFGLTRFDFTAYIIQSGAELDLAFRVKARNIHTPLRDTAVDTFY